MPTTPIDLEILRIECRKSRDSMNELLECLENNHHAGTPGWNIIFDERTEKLFQLLSQLRNKESQPDKTEASIFELLDMNRPVPMTPLNPDSGHPKFRLIDGGLRQRKRR